MALEKKLYDIVLGFQKNEITEHNIYKRLSEILKNAHNKEVLANISKDELRHYTTWKKYTGINVRPNWLKYWFYLIVSLVFGVTFGMKLMEGGEKGAQKAYDDISTAIPEALAIKKDEEEHESELVAMIDEEKLKYIGSVVLGLSDALVEFTGTLAGLTFALQNAKIIGIAGLITGIAASLSMGASEYLSTKTEAEDRDPLKAAFYTTLTYFFAVAVLVAPYLILTDYIVCLGLTLLGAIILIFVFTFYYAVVKDISFKVRFLEMFGICMSVAAASFAIGLLIRRLLGIQV
jgi:VIT1/CCC1 family predicted Fe2+/Mn2+ transporter